MSWEEKCHKVPISIIGVPISDGQPKKGVGKGPEALRKAGLVDQIKSINPNLEDLGDLKFENLEEKEKIFNMKNFKSVAQANKKFADEVEKIIKNERFCIAIGGDHSMGIGAVQGHARVHPNLGVIWVDAHPDINPPLASGSGNIHGMPVSFLMKELDIYMKKDLPEMDWFKPCISKKDIVYIAIRDMDEAEKKIIEELNIKSFSMGDVMEKGGIHNVIMEAIEYLNPSKKRPIHLSFDIDSLDPNDAASTGTPVPGGLTLREGVHIAEVLAMTGHLQMIVLTEVNPELGTEEDKNRTLTSALEVIGGCFLKRHKRQMAPGYVIPKP